jgi:hypothetical protein
VSGCLGTPTVTAPGNPSNVAVSYDAQASSATLTWAPPADDGASPVTGYTLSLGGGTPVVLDRAARSHTFTGLRGATSYTFSVAAANAVGGGSAATVSQVSPAMPFSAPAYVTLSDFTAGHVLVAWTPPSDLNGNAAVDHYRLTLAGPGGSTELAPTQAQQVLTGLAAGASYSVSVQAVGPSGVIGATTSLPFVYPAPPSPPGAPGIEKAIGGKAGGRSTATVRWSAPSVAGTSAVTGYRITALRVGAHGRVLSTHTFRVTADLRSKKLRLRTGHYRFQVAALSSVGVGAPSARSNRVRAR